VRPTNFCDDKVIVAVNLKADIGAVDIDNPDSAISQTENIANRNVEFKLIHCKSPCRSNAINSAHARETCGEPLFAKGRTITTPVKSAKQKSRANRIENILVAPQRKMDTIQ
jgi:hypothetical protein